MIGEHHASRMDPHVPRQTRERCGSITHKGWRLSPALGPGRSRADGVSKGARDVADRRARAIRDDVGNLGRAIPPKGVVDVLDDLFAAARLDVDVDIGRPRTGVRQKPLEEQVVAHCVYCRDPEAVAHR